MIRYFAVENFRSIKEENIVEFDTQLPKDGCFVSNPTIGIAGANASGKTSFLQALTFIFWFMQDSFLKSGEKEEIPTEPFITCGNLPTKLHLIFSQRILVDDKPKNVDYEYILWVTQEEVIKEELLYYPYNRKRIVYQRNKDIIKQGSTIAKLEPELWNNLRKNCSIVSFAAQFNSQTVAKQCRNYHFLSNLTYQGRSEYEFKPNIIGSLIDEHDLAKDKIITLLKIADLGIEDFEIKEELDEIEQELHNILEQIDFYINQSIEAGIAKVQRQNFEHIQNLQIKLDNVANAQKNKRGKIYRSLLFKHKVEDSTKDFRYTSESSGTLQFLALLYRIILALRKGSLFIIDEIEIKLHQNLVAYIIGLFQNKYENPHEAQLIFSFHNTYFMEILSPSQLWFTEKNDRGCTEIFSAADFKDIRKLQQKNLEELYRLGKFGAKPRGI